MVALLLGKTSMNEKHFQVAEAERKTLSTIMLATGFGVPTVARALKNTPVLSDETRHAVNAKALRLDHHTNRAIVRIRTENISATTAGDFLARAVLATIEQDTRASSGFGSVDNRINCINGGIT